MKFIESLKRLLEVMFTKPDIMFDPTTSEVQRAFHQQETKESPLRFVLTPEGHYYVADSAHYVHYDIRKNMGVQGGKVDGFLFPNGEARMFYTYTEEMAKFFGIEVPDGNSEQWFNPEFQDRVETEIKRKFKQTDFYRNLSSIITRIEIR